MLMVRHRTTIARSWCIADARDLLASQARMLPKIEPTARRAYDRDRDP
jgi:hypothetical protein